MFFILRIQSILIHAHTHTHEKMWEDLKETDNGVYPKN